MNPEQVERIANHIQNGGFGWIPKDDLQNIIRIVRRELIVEAVFTGLSQSKSQGKNVESSERGHIAQSAHLAQTPTTPYRQEPHGLEEKRMIPIENG